MPNKLWFGITNEQSPRRIRGLCQGSSWNKLNFQKPQAEGMRFYIEEIKRERGFLFYKSSVRARRVTTMITGHKETRDHLMLIYYSPDPILSTSLGTHLSLTTTSDLFLFLPAVNPAPIAVLDIQFWKE